MSQLYAQVYAMVRQIPAGNVATYGQIARMLNRPRIARQVGYALAALPHNSDVPWHRIVNAQGFISLRAEYADYQRMLLEAEGIELNHHGKIDLKRFAFLPELDA